MKSSILKVKLNEEKGKLKQKFAALTEDDRLHDEGRKEEVYSKYQSMFFMTRDELDNILSTLDLQIENHDKTI